jgi:hypothetical protein
MRSSQKVSESSSARAQVLTLYSIVLLSDSADPDWRNPARCLRPVRRFPARTERLWPHLAVCEHVSSELRLRAKGVCAQRGYLKEAREEETAQGHGNLQ